VEGWDDCERIYKETAIACSKVLSGCSFEEIEESYKQPPSGKMITQGFELYSSRMQVASKGF
jgi:hypothetical protein